jgi:Sec-independent protein secretion pathway component TatC
VLAFRRVMVVALSSVAATLGLVVVFFVIFPVLVQGLIAFAVAQVIGERAENQEYVARRRARRQQ